MVTYCFSQCKKILSYFVTPQLFKLPAPTCTATNAMIPSQETTSKFEVEKSGDALEKESPYLKKKKCGPLSKTLRLHRKGKNN